MRSISALAIAISVVAPLGAQPVKTGTFNKPAIVVAFYRSSLWSATMKARLDELQAAKAANDTAKVQQLNAWGEAHQETSHKQLSGEAPLTNILEALSPAFPEIAQKAHVSFIAADVLYANPGAKPVDVTDFILDWLKSDDLTRKMVQKIRDHKGPLPPLH